MLTDEFVDVDEVLASESVLLISGVIAAAAELAIIGDDEGITGTAEPPASPILLPMRGWGCNGTEIPGRPVDEGVLVVDMAS